MIEKIDCLEGECFCLPFTEEVACIYSVSFPNWMVVMILSHLMGYFLSLSISDLIRDIERAVY